MEHMGALNNMLMALNYEDQTVPLRDAHTWLELVHDKTGRWAKVYLGGACRDKLPSTARDKFW